MIYSWFICPIFFVSCQTFFSSKGVFSVSKEEKIFWSETKKKQKKFHNTICSIEGSLLINKKHSKMILWLWHLFLICSNYLWNGNSIISIQSHCCCTRCYSCPRRHRCCWCCCCCRRRRRSLIPLFNVSSEKRICSLFKFWWLMIPSFIWL